MHTNARIAAASQSPANNSNTGRARSSSLGKALVELGEVGHCVLRLGSLLLLF